MFLVRIRLVAKYLSYLAHDCFLPWRHPKFDVSEWEAEMNEKLPLK